MFNKDICSIYLAECNYYQSSTSMNKIFIRSVPKHLLHTVKIQSIIS